MSQGMSQGMMVQKEPLINYNFLLRVEGMFDLPCKSITGVQRKEEYEYIQEGGVNDYVHIRRKPASEPNIFQVECYVGTGQEDVLSLGTRFSMPMQILIARCAGDFEKPKRTFEFKGCVVTEKQYGELNAERGEILTEITTIAYQTMTCKDAGTESPKQVWKFDKTNAKGNGKRSARTLESFGIQERKNKNARLWPKVSSAKNIKNYLKP